MKIIFAQKTDGLRFAVQGTKITALNEIEPTRTDVYFEDSGGVYVSLNETYDNLYEFWVGSAPEDSND